MSTPLRIGLVPFAEAIAATESRGVVLPGLYYGVLQGVERAQAFSIAGIAKLDQLQQALDSLTKAISGGQTFGEWQQQTLKAPAVLSLPPHRLDNIFRTNIQGAYARGKCLHIQSNREARPYLVYSAINDSRTRPAHLAMSGFVARANDPIWQTAMPPNGYRCRCTVVSLSEAEALKRMQRDADRLANDSKAKADRDQTLLRGCADRGWDYSPCAAEPDGLPESLVRLFTEKRERYAAPLRPLLDALVVATVAAFIEAWREDRGDDEEDEE